MGLKGLLNLGRKVGAVAAPIVGGAFGGPAGAAAGQALGKAIAPKQSPARSGGPVGVSSHVSDPGPSPMPPIGATASSLGAARSQDKMRMRRQYGM